MHTTPADAIVSYLISCRISMLSSFVDRTPIIGITTVVALAV